MLVGESPFLIRFGSRRGRKGASNLLRDFPAKSLRSYACRCFRAMEASPGLRRHQLKKLSICCPRMPPKGFSEAPGPAPFFGKFEKVEIVKKSRKNSTTVIHGGHSHRSLPKTESTFITVEHRGWRRWSREALFNNYFY